MVTRNRFTASSTGYGAACSADARLACLTSRFRGSSMSRDAFLTVTAQRQRVESAREIQLTRSSTATLEEEPLWALFRSARRLEAQAVTTRPGWPSARR